jgi:hypothetical protein
MYNISKLKKLSLDYSSINDNDIKLLLLKGKNICDLDISYCENLTDDCMESIAALTNLQTLNLSCCCKITGKGIAFLSSHNNLLFLNLSDFCNTNNSLIHVAKIANLKKLDISFCDLDFNNIKYLINNKKLHTLYISSDYEIDIKKTYLKNVNIIIGSFNSHIYV